MSYDGRAVANFVLDQCDAAGVPVTHLALQKLVYFCHVWSLIELHRPLIRHHFEAWEHGPVLQYLYREFSGFGAQSIHARAQWLNPHSGARERVPYAFDQETVVLLNRVVGFYGRLPASTLVELTHAADGPWHKVWYRGGRINPGMKIDNYEIERFYSRIQLPVTLQ